MRIGEVTQRVPLLEVVEDFGLLRGAGGPGLGLDRAGRDQVGADATRAVFDRQSLGVADQAGLGGAIGRMADGQHGVDRADIDDDARTAGEHGVLGGLDAVIGGAEIDRQIVRPVLGLEVRQGRRGSRAGIVDQDVDRAGPGRQFGHGGFDSVDVGQVGRRLVQARIHGVQGFGGAIERQDGGAPAEEGLAQALADTAGGAGDEHDLAGKIKHKRSLW